MEGYRNMGNSVPLGKLKDAIDRSVESGYPFFLEGEAAEDVLRFLDSSLEDMIRSLNRLLSQWACKPGDEGNEDFRMPEFIIRNADRFSREIGDLNMSADGGKLVQVSGTLLYLSDPVEIEFVRVAYLCQECSEYTVTEGEKPESCDHCGSRKLKFG
jgi:DNA-directed RNA polymerase subunit RPC12/RpoP